MTAPKLRLQIAPRARWDIREIRLRSLDLWGKSQAMRYHAAIRNCLDTIYHNPEIGVIRDDLAPGIRARRINRHIVYYRMRDDVIEIVRVLHERQDVASILGEELLP